jgi:steroid 5-alpha reductase family enzyme
MGAVNVLDRYYLAITLLITVGYQLLFFSIAFSLKFDKLTDFAGGTNFILLAILTLAFSDARDNARNVVVSVFITVWAARLSGFLLFRIIKTGKDDRFDDKRDKFFSFLGFWVFQMIWVWTVSLPVTVLNSPGVTRWGQPSFGTGRDIAGVILYTIGFAMESISDIQKYHFRSKHGSDGAVCDTGLFKVSRHPNYFGEMIIQFGKAVPQISERQLRHLSYLYDCGFARSERLHQGRRIPCSIRNDPWPILLDHSPHVRFWIDAAGKARREETIRKGDQLACVCRVSAPDVHPHPIPSSDILVASDFPETHRFP